MHTGKCYLEKCTGEKDTWGNIQVEGKLPGKYTVKKGLYCLIKSICTGIGGGIPGSNIQVGSVLPGGCTGRKVLA